jgi:hypothetical protein
MFMRYKDTTTTALQGQLENRFQLQFNEFHLYITFIFIVLLL